MVTGADNVGSSGGMGGGESSSGLRDGGGSGGRGVRLVLLQLSQWILSFLR